MQNTNVPNGWVKTTLGKVGEVSMCKRIMKHQTNDVGGVPFFKIGTFGGIADAYIDKDLFCEYKKKYSYPNIGDILLSAAGTIGRLVVFDGNDAYFQDSNIVWVSNNEKLVINKYLYYLYRIIKWRTSEGGIVSRLYNNEIRKTEIVIPPFEEQKKIAEILGTWDRAIEELTDLIAEKKELKRGLMQRLLTGIQRLPGFTKPWKKDFLSNLCDIETGKKDVNEGNPAGQYPFFTCAKTHTFADTFSYDKEAILIAGNGDVGNCQYYNGKFEAYQRTYILSNFRTDVRLLFQILDTKMSRYAESQKQQGAMPYIKLSTLTDFIVYMPEDFAEQKAIAEVLTKADAEIDLLNQQLDVLREQKRGLMQKLLTGEIRVKVDVE